MPYQYFIYDLDGTLLDTSPGILASLREMERRAGIDPLPEATLLRFIGPPLTDSISRYYQAGPQRTQELLELYRELYAHKGIDNAQHYPGVREGLEWIRAHGGQMAVATLKQQLLAVQTLEIFGLGTYFVHLAGLRPGEPADKGALVLECLEAMGCRDKSQAILFGDSRYDGEGARKAGIDFVPLLYGFGFTEPDSLEGIPWVAQVQHPSELLDFITRNIG